MGLLKGFLYLQETGMFGVESAQYFVTMIDKNYDYKNFWGKLKIKYEDNTFYWAVLRTIRIQLTTYMDDLNWALEYGIVSK